jgi:hypothetical protein
LLGKYGNVCVIEDSYFSVMAKEVSLRAHSKGVPIDLQVFDGSGRFYFEGDSRIAMHALAGLAPLIVAEKIIARWSA